MKPIELLEPEVTLAAFGGAMKNLSALFDGLKLEPGRFDFGFDSHIMGSIGELVMAKACDLYYSPHVGVCDTHIGDVGRWQVKTIFQPHHKLIIPEDADPGFNFALVLVRFIAKDNITGQVLGWIRGADGKHRDHWHDKDIHKGGPYHKSAYFVPQDKLRSFPPADME